MKGGGSPREGCRGISCSLMPSSPSKRSFQKFSRTTTALQQVNRSPAKGGAEAAAEAEAMVVTTRKLGIRMWGHLPSCSPRRGPILNPAEVPFNPLATNVPNDGWKAACSGGCGFSLAISESGKLFTWGSTDEFGKCYDITGAGKDLETPELFDLQCDPIVFASAGWSHCAAVTENGSVYTWGWKECVPVSTNKTTADEAEDGSKDSKEPELSQKPKTGNGKTRRVCEGKEHAPKKRKCKEVKSCPPADVEESLIAPPCCVLLPSGVKIVKVASGGRHTLALTDSGHVWSWGYGGEGQLGLGLRARTVPVPQFVSMNPLDAAKAIGIACGGRHSVVLMDTGAMLTFGWGQYGQCGQGSTVDELSPQQVSSLDGLPIAAVAAGLWHTLCITRSGDVYAFGGNQFGQLGVGGDKEEQVLPKLVRASVLEGECATSVSCGARHSAICTEKGEIYSWGWNKYGQLGLGDTIDQGTPQPVSLDCAALNVACGWWHTLALTELP